MPSKTSIFKALAWCIVGALASRASADVAPEPKAFPAYSGFYADLPLLDAPYNLDSPAYPSMAQTVRFSTAAYQTLHWGIGHLVDPYRPGWKGFWSRLAFVGFDSIAAYLPLFDSWVHEEYHRAVMGYRGISSYDDVYNFDIGASVIAVSHVKDEDLIELKRDHPADMVRLPAAGLEGESHLALSLEKDTFFDETRNFHQGAILIAYANGYAYLASGSNSDADTMTDDMNESEDTVKVRDFVGHDFTSWVYDLFRPDEPYEARGVHPSGVGIDRYRKNSDLTAAESRYLERQANLHLLSFVDPMFWGFRHFTTASGWRWNASMQHYLTSFGYAVNGNFFLSKDDTDLFATLLNYHNQDLSLWGLDLELRRLPLRDFPLVKAVSARGHAYRQPTHQLFRDQTSRLGGLGSVTLFFPFVEDLDYYVEIERKTPGWVIGTPYLDAVTSGRVGVLLQAF